EHDVAATGLNLCGDALATLNITISKGHLRPFGDEAPHGGLTNPRRPASDGGHFPTELSHRYHPLVRVTDSCRSWRCWCCTGARLYWRVEVNQTAFVCDHGVEPAGRNSYGTIQRSAGVFPWNRHVTASTRIRKVGRPRSRYVW